METVGRITQLTSFPDPPLEPATPRSYPILCRACSEWLTEEQVVSGSEEWGYVEREDYQKEWGIIANCIRCEQGGEE